MDDNNNVNEEKTSDKEDRYVLRMATCQAPECKFSVLSQNEQEAVEVLQHHAKTFHDHDVPADKIMANLETVQG